LLGPFSLLLLPVALWALKGCPVCWTIGLIETLTARGTGAEPVEARVERHCVNVPMLAPAAKANK
jgi:hypothetical protein